MDLPYELRKQAVIHALYCCHFAINHLYHTCRAHQAGKRLLKPKSVVVWVAIVQDEAFHDLRSQQQRGADEGAVRLSDSARIDDLVKEFRDQLEAFGSRIEECDRTLTTGQAMEIVRAVLWLNACRVNSAAAVYALDSLVQALGPSLIVSIESAQAFEKMTPGKAQKGPG